MMCIKPSVTRNNILIKDFILPDIWSRVSSNFGGPMPHLLELDVFHLELFEIELDVRTSKWRYLLFFLSYSSGQCSGDWHYFEGCSEINCVVHNFRYIFWPILHDSILNDIWNSGVDCPIKVVLNSTSHSEVCPLFLVCGNRCLKA